MSSGGIYLKVVEIAENDPLNEEAGEEKDEDQETRFLFCPRGKWVRAGLEMDEIVTLSSSNISC